MSRPAAQLPALLILVLLVSGGTAHADRLHLESGGFLDIDAWWIEGDWVMYESAGGTVGIPRSMVVRVEPGVTPPPPRSRAPSPEPPARGPRLQELAQEGLDAFREGDYESASNRFFRVLQTDPELHAARSYYVMSEIRLGHDGSALSALLDGLTRAPQRAEFHELLGDLRDREGNVEQALRAWRKAFELAPSDRVREKILKGERDEQASGDFDLSRSSHFNLRFDGSVDSRLAAAMIDFLEEKYWSLAESYEHTPAQPITVLLYPNREFRSVTQSPDWVGGVYDGKIRVPLAGLERLTSRAERVLLHELTHAVVHSKTRGRCPRWLHEGLAQRTEGRRVSDAERSWIVDQLRGRDAAEWESGTFSYAMALSLTGYLEGRRGFGNLVYLLELLGEGVELDAALMRIYGEDYPALCRGWARALPG